MRGPQFLMRAPESRFVLLLAMLAGCRSAPAANPPVARDTIRFHQELSWSPDGQWIVFSEMEIDRARWEREQYEALEGTQYDLFRVRPDGSELARITRSAESEVWTTWSPDGSRLAFGGDGAGSAGIHATSPDGGGRELLVAGASAPAFSPDGKRLAYTRKVDGKSQILVSDAHGAEERQLTSEPANHWNPAWSPDGSWLVFYTDRKGPGRDQVVRIRPDGSGETSVTDDDHNHIFASWSPDGTRVLFASETTDGRRGVFEASLGGGEPRQIVEGAFYARWSPDGSRLAYIAGTFPETEIRVMDADGSRSRRIVPPAEGAKIERANAR